MSLLTSQKGINIHVNKTLTYNLSDIGTPGQSEGCSNMDTNGDTNNNYHIDCETNHAGSENGSYRNQEGCFSRCFYRLRKSLRRMNTHKFKNCQVCLHIETQ